MNIFRLAGDMTHLASVLVLLLKIHTIKSCAEATKSGEWLDKGGDWNGEGRCGEWRECPDLRNTKKLMDWAKNTAEKAQLLATCFAAVTAHKLESAQPQKIMPPKDRRRAARTVESQAQSQNNEQEQHQPEQSVPNAEAQQTNLLLELIQDDEIQHENPHQEPSSHNNKEEPFITLSEVADLLQQEREKILKEPRHFVKKPPYPAKLLKQPYPDKYVTPTFSRFDGRKGSALVHVSKFLDSMGPYAGNGDLCLREFSKSLEDRAYTWYTTLSPGSVRSWDDMVEMFCGKYFQAEEKVTLVNLHGTKQGNGEDLVKFAQLLQKARKTALSVRPHVEKTREKKYSPQTLTVSAGDDKRRKKFVETPPPVPCTREEMITILNKWVADGVIQLPDVQEEATEEEKKSSKYCHYHRSTKHSITDCWTLRRKFHARIQDRTLELPQAQQRVHIDPFLKHKGKATVSVIIHGSASDIDMSESAATNPAMTPAAIRTLQRNPKFRSLFDQLGLNPEARTAATEAIMSIAAESGTHCFTAEAHASRAFLETTNAITFMDEDMDVPYPDHRRLLYLAATINEVQVRRALVDTGSCINLVPLSTLQAAGISQKRIQGLPWKLEQTPLPLTSPSLILWKHHSPNQSELHSLVDEEDSSEMAGATGKSAVTEETIAADPRISAKEELEVIDLSSDPSIQRLVSISASLSASKRAQLVALLKEYQDIFAWQYNEMPGIDPTLVAHSLNIEPGAKPVVQPMRTFHPEVEAQISQEVKKLLSAGFIKLIQHLRWLSNIVPVKKKNGQIRCCVDFRDLNKACPKDEFPLPNMDLLIDSATGHAMFSFMDGFSGYNQILMSPNDAEKTAFYTPIGNFYYTVMPFGLKNVGATYQRTMTAMFHDMMHREIEDYVDDIVVKSKKREDHLVVLRRVFERCRIYKLKMNPLKCAFGVAAGKFLGFLVHQRGIDVDPTRASVIASMKPPTTHKELKSFLGKLSYIRRFIPGLAAVTTTFAPLLKKGVPFRWSLECQQAFERVQEIMAKLPTLMTKSHPIRSLLQCPVLSGRLAQWLLQLSQYEIIAETPTAIKSQAITDLLAQFPGEDNSSISDEVPGEVDEVFMVDLAAIPKSFKLDFPCSNNVAEYETYLTGLAVAWEMGIKHLKVVGDSNLIVCQACGEFSLKEHSLAPYRALAQKLEEKFATFEIEHAQRNKNRYADALATLGSQMAFEGQKIDITINKKVKPITELLKEEFEELSLGEEDWRMPLKAKLVSPVAAADFKEIKDYTLISGELYRRLPGGVLARCISIQEAKRKLIEVHEKTCEAEGGISLYRRLQRLGYYWPNMSREAADLQSILPQTHKEVYRLKKLASRYFVEGGTLFRKGYHGEPLRCLSLSESQMVMKEAHAGECGEHQGKKRLYQHLLTLGYYWPTMKKDAADFVRTCHTCQVQANLIHTHPTNLQNMTTPWPFHTWGLDLIGPIGPASSGHIWILVATEYFTKWVEAVSLRRATGAAVANFIREHIITRFGIPYKLISDNGTPFVNKDVRELLEHYQVKHRRSTPYYPQGNGQAEATNRMLLRILSKMVFDYGSNWNSHLADVLWAYRGSPKTATGFTPFSLVYGTDTISPTELVVPTPRVLQGSDLEADANICAEARMADLEGLDESRDLARLKSQRNYQKMANAYSKTLQVRIFAEG
uniref:Integrase catalytic domain-containing protein n=2 Tax=Pentapetalae TaxID=1437201 RepID=A0A2N9I4R3_FAGSY